jgi:hypothetical protein
VSRTPRTPPPAATPATETAAARPTIFISYRHESPTTDIARKLNTALVPPAHTWKADIFRDEHDLEPAELYDRKILDALDRTTHFIVLLTNSYWSSPYCRKELDRIEARFEKDRSVRLLFVMVELFDPTDFPLKHFTAGDLQFLGPFDEQLRLVPLEWDRPAMLARQLAQLIERLRRVIAK